MFSIHLTQLLLCSHLWGASPAPRVAHQVDQLLESIQSTWSGIETLQTQFDQTVTSKSLGIPDQAQGTLFVKKPNQYRWEARNGESIQIVA